MLISLIWTHFILIVSILYLITFILFLLILFLFNYFHFFDIKRINLYINKIKKLALVNLTQLYIGSMSAGQQF